MADLEDFYDQKATELAEKLVRTLQQDRDDLGNESADRGSRIKRFGSETADPQDSNGEAR